MLVLLEDSSPARHVLSPGQEAAPKAFAIAILSETGERLYFSVNLRRRSKTDAFSICWVARQRQFPSEQPGVFIRASAPNSSRSCTGAMANMAREDHACWTNSLAILPAPPSLQRRELHTLLCCSSDNASYHPRVVLLS